MRGYALKEWVSSQPFTCGACGGLVPRYVWYEKEAFAEGLLFPEAGCICPWRKRLEDQLEQLYAPSRSESLQRFYRLLEREGIPLEYSQ